MPYWGDGRGKFDFKAKSDDFMYRREILLHSKQIYYSIITIEGPSAKTA